VGIKVKDIVGRNFQIKRGLDKVTHYHPSYLIL
jgi:hypothetical protein